MIIQLFILLILIYLYTNQIIDRHILIHFIILYMCIILVSNRKKETFIMDKVSPKKIYNYEKWKDDPENTNNHLYFNFNIGCSVFKHRIPNKTYLSDYDFETTKLENKNLERLLYNYIYVNPESIEEPDTPPEIFNIAIPSPCLDSNITKTTQDEIKDNTFEYNTLKAIQVMTGFKAILYTNRNTKNDIKLNNNSSISNQHYTKNYNYGTDDEPNFIKVNHMQMSNPRKIIHEPRTELTGLYYKEYAKPEFVNKPDINSDINSDKSADSSCAYTNILGSNTILSQNEWLLNTNFANYRDCKTRFDLDSNSYQCKSKQLYYGVNKYYPPKKYKAKAVLNGPVLINLSNHRFKHLPSTLNKITSDGIPEIIQNSHTIDKFNDKLKKEIAGDYVKDLSNDELFKDGRQGKNVYKNEIKPSTNSYKLIDDPTNAVIGVIPIQPWWYDLNDATTKIIVEYLSPEHNIYDSFDRKTNYSIRTSSDNNSYKIPLMEINYNLIDSSNKLNFETPQIHQWFYLKTTTLSRIRLKQIDITVELKLFTDGIDNDLNDQEYYFKSIWGNIKPEVNNDNNDDINYNTPLDMTIQKQCNFGTPVIDNNHISGPYKINNTKTISINIPKLPNIFNEPISANNQPIEEYSYGFNYFAFQSLGYLGFNITHINIVEHPNIFVLIYNKNQGSDDSDDNLIKLYNYNQFEIPINSTDESLKTTDIPTISESKKFIIDEPENKLDVNCRFMNDNIYFKNSKLCTININTAIDNINSSNSIPDNSIELNPALYSSNKFMIGLTIENIEYGNTIYDKSDKKYTPDPINLIQIKYKDSSSGKIQITPLLSIDNVGIGKPIKVLNTSIDKCKLINLPNSNQNKHMISPKITFLLVYNEPDLVLYYMINNIIYSKDINTDGTTDDSKINTDSYKDILSSFIITHIGGIPQNGTIKNVIINTNPTNQLLKYDPQNILNIFKNIAIEKSVSVNDYELQDETIKAINDKYTVKVSIRETAQINRVTAKNTRITKKLTDKINLQALKNARNKQLAAEAKFKGYDLAPEGDSCTKYCNDKNQRCDKEAVQNAATDLNTCKKIITKIKQGQGINKPENEIIRTSGTYLFDDSGCTYSEQSKNAKLFTKSNNKYDIKCNLSTPWPNRQRVCKCTNEPLQFEMADGGQSCDQYCHTKNMQCDNTKLNQITSSYGCKSAINYIKKNNEEALTTRMAATYRDKNSGCTYDPSQNLIQIMKKNSQVTCNAKDGDTNRHRICPCKS